MQIGDHYKGFVITWVEPPVSAHKWVLNINAEDKAGLTKLGRTEVIKGATLDEAMAKAKKGGAIAPQPHQEPERRACLFHKSLALQHPADARKPSQGHRDAKEESREQIDRAHSYARRNPLRTN